MPAERQNVCIQQSALALCVSATNREPRLRRLTACFAAAFALAPEAAPAVTTWIVNNCADSGAGSLRGQIGMAAAGDIIDLSTAQLTCSVITLTSGEIQTPDLALVGPTTRTVSITTHGVNRLLHHVGSGSLEVQNLTLSGGYYFNHLGNAVGGCIASNGDVSLFGSVVSGCEAYTYAGYAKGGGIYALKSVHIYNSRVVANAAYAFNNRARGGGIYADQGVRSEYSTISGNVARGGHGGLGGGAYAFGTAELDYSTIDSNVAEYAAGIRILTSSSSIVLEMNNSTISGNQASIAEGGLGVVGSSKGFIRSSTIAFNSAPSFAGMFALGVTTYVQSSILARNSNGHGGFADLYIDNGSWVADKGLVQSYNVAPTGGLGLLTADPQLAPLAYHGGVTRTHALLATSPAIDTGFNFSGGPYDQRGIGFPREVPSGKSDIGAYERQVDDDEIFYSGFN